MVCTQESYHKLVRYDRPGECSPEKDCLWWHRLRFRQPERKSLPESSHMTLTMTSAQVVETSVDVTANSPSQDYTHPGDHTLRTYKMMKNTPHKGVSFMTHYQLYCFNFCRMFQLYDHWRLQQSQNVWEPKPFAVWSLRSTPGGLVQIQRGSRKPNVWDLCSTSSLWNPRLRLT